MSKLTIARILIIIGFVIGLESLYATFTHIGDQSYLLLPEFENGQTHAWYHALREALGDVGAIVAVLFVFFTNSRYRNETSWWLCLIIMVGYYSPFWAGMPFNSELAAPTLESEIRHITQAVLPLSGLFIVRKEFFATGQAEKV